MTDAEESDDGVAVELREDVFEQISEVIGSLERGRRQFLNGYQLPAIEPSVPRPCKFLSAP